MYRMKKNKYLDSVKKNLNLINPHQLLKATNIISKINKRNKVILAGNGASSSISSHVSIDLTKAAGIRATNFNEANLLTCFSNDYGYENWLKKALEFYSLPGDILILISSSGKSENIIKAAKAAKKLKLKLITLSGFSKNNPLSKKGIVNFHVDSKIYNVVESLHLTILLNIVENLIKKN